MAARRLLSWPAVLILCAAVVLNAAKNWLLIHSATNGPIHPLVEQFGPTIDIFGWALLLLAASVFTSMKQEGTFPALRLAGLTWRQIFSPLFRLVFLVCVVDALVELTVQVLSGNEPPVVNIFLMVGGSVFGLASAWNFTAWLFLLNVLRMPRVFQFFTVTALIFMIMTISYPLYIRVDAVLQTVYERFPAILIPLTLAAPNPQHAHYFAPLWMSEIVCILLLAVFFALLAPLVYRLALRLAERTLLQ